MSLELNVNTIACSNYLNEGLVLETREGRLVLDGKPNPVFTCWIQSGRELSYHPI